MEILPVADLPAYTEAVTLDGLVYSLDFAWNTREGAWYLSIGKDGVRVLSGLKVVDNYELIGRFAKDSLPPGLILTLDIEGIKRNPGRDELGSAVKLAYLTQGERENGPI